MFAVLTGTTISYISLCIIKIPPKQIYGITLCIVYYIFRCHFCIHIFFILPFYIILPYSCQYCSLFVFDLFAFFCSLFMILLFDFYVIYRFLFTISHLFIFFKCYFDKKCICPHIFSNTKIYLKKKSKIKWPN